MNESLSSGQIGIPADNWGLAILIAATSGFAGGIAEALLSVLEKREHSFHASPVRNCAVNVLFHGAIGAVTGVCGLFLVLLSPITASLRSGAFWAFLAGVSAVFGLFAKKLLPGLRDSLSKRIGITERELHEMRGELNLNSLKASVLEEISRANQEGAVPSRTDRAVEQATHYLVRVPQDRLVATKLARLIFEKKEDKPGAIRVLDKYIEAMKSGPSLFEEELYKSDLANALYDRACFKLVRPGPVEGLRDQSLTENEIRSALADLQYAYELTPDAVRADAIVDSDLRWLRENNENFQVMLGLAPA